MATVIVDKSRLLVINPSTREIMIPKSERIFGVHKENGVERKYFKCPRMIGGNLDLAECYIFINYISSSGKHGQILCTDVEPLQTDNACITFSWELTDNVFDENKDATIYFSVHAKEMTDEGTLDQVFCTRIAKGMSYSTIDSTQHVVAQNADVIVQLVARMTKLEEAGIKPEDFEEAFKDYLETNPLEKQIKTNETLKVTADGKLAVNTADKVEKDNTLPVTSSAVQVQVGNIDALLQTI